MTPHLEVNGAARYLEFLKKAFGAREISRAEGPGGKLMHAEAVIGDSRLMFADPFPEFGSPPIAEGRWPVVLHLYVANADTAFAQAQAAGCQVTMPLSDQFWGDRYGQLKDPFGFTWAVATHMEDVAPEEMKQRMQAAFSQHGHGA